MIALASLIGFVVGLSFGFAIFRSERAYRHGFKDGERYGRAEGYRQAWRRWFKANEPLLNAETEDWNRKNEKASRPR